MSDFILSAALELRDNLTGRIRNAARSLGSIRSMASSASSSIDGTAASMNRAGTSAGRLRGQLSSLRGNYRADVSARDMATPTLNRVRQDLNSVNGRSVSATVQVRDEATSRIGRIRQELNSLTSRVHTAVVNIKQNGSAMMSKMGSSVSNAANGMLMGAGAQMMGMAGVGYGIYDAVKTYRDFEYQMASVRAITGANSDEMARLTKKAKELGETTMFKASEVGKAEEYMGFAGWKTAEIEAGLKPVLNLAAAAGEELAGVSDIITDAMTGFGLKATDEIKTVDGKVVNATAHFADIMAALATNANTTVGMAGESAKYSAAVVGSLYSSQSAQDKMDAVSDWAVVEGLMANAGIKGSMAGTAQRAMLTRLASLQQNANAARSAMGIDFAYQESGYDERGLYHEAGQTRRLRDIIGDIRSRFGEGMSAEDLMGAAEILEGKTFSKQQKAKIAAMVESVKAKGGTMSDQDKATMTTMLAGQEGLAAWLSVLLAAEGDVDKLTKAIDGASGKAQEMADIKMYTLDGSIKSLGSAWEALQLELFEGQGGAGIRNFVDAATEDIRKFKKYLEDGFDISDIGKITLDIVNQLKDKFLEMDGVGSVLAGGALLAGLYKISSVAISVKNKLQDLIKSPTTGGRSGGVSPSSVGDLASSVNNMVVNARSVVINGRVAGGNSGGGIDVPDIPDGENSGGRNRNGRRRVRPAQGRGRRVSVPSGASTMAAETAAETAAGAAASGGRLASVGKLMGKLTTPIAVAAGAWEAYSVSQENDERSAAAQEKLDRAEAYQQKLAEQIQAENKDPNMAAALSEEDKAALQDAQKEYEEAVKEKAEIEKENVNRMGEAVGGASGALVGGLAGAKAGAVAGGAIGAAFGGVGAAPGAAIGGFIGGIGGAIAGSELGASIGAQTTEIQAAFSSAWESVKAEAANTGEWLSNQFEGIKNSAGDAWQGVKDKAQNEWDYVKNSAGELAQGIEEKWNGVKDAAYQNLYVPIHDAFVDVTNFVVGAGVIIGSAIGEAFAPVVEWLDANVWQPIKETAGAAWNTIGEEISAKWETMTTTFSETAAWFDMSVWQPIKETAALAWTDISALPSEAAALISAAWTEVSVWFDTSVWQPLSTGASAAWDTVTTTAGATWDSISAFFAPAAAWFDGTVWQPISSAVSGVQSAITGAFETAWSAVTGIWASAGAWFESNVIAPVKSAFAKVASIGSSVTGLTKIGGNAIGTSYWSGGWTEVNEHGGEIIDLPQGSRIYPHATTMKMLQSEFAPAAEVAQSSVSSNVGWNVAGILSSGLSSMFQQVQGLFNPQISTPEQIVTETTNNNGGAGQVGNSAPAMPSVNISGNEFVIREDADIGRIAYELFRLFSQSAGNYQVV